MVDAVIDLTADRLRSLLHYDPETGVFTWRVSRGPCKAGQVTGLCKGIRIDWILYKRHRLAWLYVTGQWPTMDIDHRDGNDANNRWNNLREATDSQNLGNAKKPITNRSGYKGVSWHSAGRRWQAHIKVENVNHYLGLFSDPRAAHAAYVEAAVALRGEFARAA